MCAVDQRLFKLQAQFPTPEQAITDAKKVFHLEGTSTPRSRPSKYSDKMERAEKTDVTRVDMARRDIKA